MATGVQTTYNSGYLSPDQFFDQQDVLPTIFNGYDDRGKFGALLFRTGAKKITVDTTFNHWEHDPLRVVAAVESVSGGATANATLVITMEEVDHQISGTKSPFAIKNLLVLITATGEVPVYVVDKSTSAASAHTISVKPVDPLVILAEVGSEIVDAGDLIVQRSNAKGDGNAHVPSPVRKPKMISGQVQIFSSKYTAFLGEAANKQKVIVEGKEYYYLQGAVDALMELHDAVDFQFLIGPSSTVLVDPTNSEIAFLSRSLNDYAVTYGKNEPYSTDPALTDWNNIMDYLDVENAPSEYIAFTGNTVDRKLDTLFKGDFDNGELVFNNWGIGSDSGRKVDYGFDGFRYNNRTVMKKKLNALNAKGTTSYTGSPWPGIAYLVPSNTVADAKGESLQRLMLRYKTSPEENRLFRHYKRGPENHGVDEMIWEYQMEAGLQCVGANHLARLYAA